MAKSRQGGYESSSKPAEELCTPPRGPAPGAGKVTNNLAPARNVSGEDATPAVANPCAAAGSILDNDWRRAMAALARVVSR